MDVNVLNIHLLLEMHNGSAITLFGTIFVDDIEQNHAVLVIYCIESIYHICKLPL